MMKKKCENYFISKDSEPAEKLRMVTEQCTFVMEEKDRQIMAVVLITELILESECHMRTQSYPSHLCTSCVSLQIGKPTLYTKYQHVYTHQSVLYCISHVKVYSVLRGKKKGEGERNRDKHSTVVAAT